MRGDLEQLFREADVDGSNFLTLNELCAAMRRLGYTGDDSVIKVTFEYMPHLFCSFVILYLHISVCEPILEETFTHSHLSWSSTIP